MCLRNKDVRSAACTGPYREIFALLWLLLGAKDESSLGGIRVWLHERDCRKENAERFPVEANREISQADIKCGVRISCET